MKAPPKRNGPAGRQGHDLNCVRDRRPKYRSYLDFARPAGGHAELRLAIGEWAPKRGDKLLHGVFVAGPDGEFSRMPVAVFENVDAACHALEWLGCGLDPHVLVEQSQSLAEA